MTFPARGHILGSLKDQPRCALPEDYFIGRDIWLDCRAHDCLQISPAANLGWNIAIVTLSHDPRPGLFGRTYGRLCRIDRLAFVAAFSLLYNCHIGEGAVVSMGSVVSGQTIPPWTMVAGNPARPIKRYSFELEKWLETAGE